jgi:hypothetical protein
VIVIFFNVLVVIVITPVVDTEIGTYVPLIVTILSDPIEVFVILNVPELTTINVNSIVVPVGVNNDDNNVTLVVDDDIRGVTPVPSVVPN